MQAVDAQLRLNPQNSTSVYLSGCRGMGKTINLKLLARHLTSTGWEVYWFASAEDIPQGIGVAFNAYAVENTNKKVAVIVDEVGDKPNSAMFTHLLKDAPSNLLTIGAAVPRYHPTGGTRVFQTVLRTSDLVLRRSDDDVDGLVDYWKVVAQDIDPVMVEFVCEHLLVYCGGHVYPVLAMMEYFFTDGAVKEFLVDKHAFLRYFASPAFAECEVYRGICTRCFDELSTEAESTRALARLLGGAASGNDVQLMIRLGWWSTDNNDILSSLLMKECLALVRPVPQCTPRYLNKDVSPEQNLENVIAEGLFHMKHHELTYAPTSIGWPVENALSFNWACHVKENYANIHMEFQDPRGGGYMDFYVDGFIDGAIEVLRNGTRAVNDSAQKGSQDIDAHLERFLTGPYKEMKDRPFALFNFAMEGKFVLPRNSEYHKNVYTYDHLANTLMRGNKIIRSPAVAGLPCKPRVAHGGLTSGKRRRTGTVGKTKGSVAHLSYGRSARSYSTFMVISSRNAHATNSAGAPLPQTIVRRPVMHRFVGAVARAIRGVR
jgi:hypothetical protein